MRSGYSILLLAVGLFLRAVGMLVVPGQVLSGDMPYCLDW